MTRSAIGSTLRFKIVRLPSVDPSSTTMISISDRGAVRTAGHEFGDGFALVKARNDDRYFHTAMEFIEQESRPMGPRNG